MNNVDTGKLRRDFLLFLPWLACHVAIRGRKSYKLRDFERCCSTVLVVRGKGLWTLGACPPGPRKPHLNLGNPQGEVVAVWWVVGKGLRKGEHQLKGLARDIETTSEAMRGLTARRWQRSPNSTSERAKFYSENTGMSCPCVFVFCVFWGGWGAHMNTSTNFEKVW